MLKNPEIEKLNLLEPWEHLGISKIRWFDTTTLQGEEWKNIPGFEGFYQASSLGRIKSVAREITQQMFTGKSREHSRKTCIRVTSKSPKGYLLLTLNQNKKHYTAHVHRYIALTFLSNPDNLPQVNHKNGIKTDNRLINLEWVNNKQNQIHACSNFIRINKLTPTEVVRIRNLRKQGVTCRELADRYGMGKEHMSDVCRGKSWSFIPGYFEPPKEGPARFTQEEKTNIKKLHESGNYSYQELQKMYKIGKITLLKIINNNG